MWGYYEAFQLRAHGDNSLDAASGSTTGGGEMTTELERAATEWVSGQMKQTCDCGWGRLNEVLTCEHFDFDLAFIAGAKWLLGKGRGGSFDADEIIDSGCGRTNYIRVLDLEKLVNDEGREEKGT